MAQLQIWNYMFDVIIILSSSFSIICSLFNDAVDKSHYIASNDLVVMILMNLRGSGTKRSWT
jgi:hypothetical protein